MSAARLAVVGSANLDVVMTVDRLPGPGETVLGEQLSEVSGGKGLNQAVAAAPYAAASFVGCLGRDPAGDLLERTLERAGVDTRHLQHSSLPTGRAFISVAADGENCIVVGPLANGALDGAHVLRALDAIRPGAVLTQLEIPFEVVEQVASWSLANGVRFVLNPSPVRSIPRAVLARCDPLILNAAEARAILRSTGTPDSGGTERVAQTLAAQTSSIAVTDGDRGAWVGNAQEGVALVPGHAVPVLDTTGAGDHFAGVLTAHLALGVALERAAGLANDSAADLVQISRADR
ncbi:MAG: ribokinase [Nocardioides sp.]|nr:ribokinase [Nocardioides sp.]